ncbi:hypothetical protein [Paenirhodobacter enshiensis]|uniref:hypothetical protein n=1 Tax=Paenirhodobacter enshiensis TaxID=1105367 RepID=UPI0035B07606
MLMVPPKSISAKRDRKERDARRGRSGEGRYNGLVKELARVIRLAFEAGATGSLWGLEGPLRAGIRSDLCLQGRTWETADLMTRDVLADAFRLAGARMRPTWNEGQPEWVIHEGLLIERTRCARCHGPLPEGRKKFCSDLCAKNYHSRLSDYRYADEDRAIKMATRLI